MCYILSSFFESFGDLNGHVSLLAHLGSSDDQNRILISTFLSVNDKCHEVSDNFKSLSHRVNLKRNKIQSRRLVQMKLLMHSQNEINTSIRVASVRVIKLLF